MTTLTRRTLLQGTAASAGALIVPSFTTAADGQTIQHMTIKPASQVLFEDAASPLWTYEGRTPGPEVRVTKGERVRVRFTNDLDEPTSVHWHGIRIENSMDGVSGLTQDPIQPGESFTYDFLAPDAGTYWYHAHNRSWNQLARGLYGPLIIDEPERPFPKDRDISLILDDWRLNEEGVLDEESIGSLHDWSHAGRLGNWLTVNGESKPTYTLQQGQPHRLRLINASNARILEIDPAQFKAKLLAYDGQPLPEPRDVLQSPLLLGPAQRVDLLVVPDEGFSVEEVSGDDGFAFLKFNLGGGTSDPVPVPAISQNSILEPDLENATLHSLAMEGGAMGGRVAIRHKGQILEREQIMATGQFWIMNGNAGLTDDPFFRAKRGETVIVEVVNDTAFAHAMHTHGHHFRILEREGRSLEDADLWRDTFLVGPRETTRIAFVADNPGKWLFHCHMLEHAAAGMNTWFEVIG